MSKSVVNKSDLQGLVREFMEAKGIPVNTVPTLVNDRAALNRLRYINEELGEWMKAQHDQDLVEVADALGDLLYFVVGCFVTYGLPMNEIFNEIHRSNMTKAMLDQYGKGGKGEQFSPPNLKPLLLEFSGNDNPAYTGPAL